MTAGATAGSLSAQVINPDGQSSNTFSFSVASLTSFALPQLAFGGGWYTALYFSNTTGGSLNLQVDFIANDGSPLQVPLAGIGSVSSQSINLNSGATAVLQAPNTGTLVQGWAEAILPPGVVGYAVLRQSIPGRADQEAVVPFTPESSQSADLIYDDIGLTSSVAIVNPGSQQTSVAITLHASDGSQIGSSQLLLPARAKEAFVLTDLPGLAAATDQRGWANFSVTSGAVSVLGLRTGAEAFTLIPVNHRSGTVATSSVSYALPQLAFGGGWYTALYFSNTTAAAVSVQVNFIGNQGLPLFVPLTAIGTTQTVALDLDPGATVILEAPNQGELVQGWAEAVLPPGVVSYGVFRQSVAGRADQEAVVPISSESSLIADMVYDDTSWTTAAAFVNPSNEQVTAVITIKAEDGSSVGATQVSLPPRSKQALALDTLTGLGAVAGQRGWATLSLPNGAISLLGLRAGTAAFTSIPVAQRYSKRRISKPSFASANEPTGCENHILSTKT